MSVGVKDQDRYFIFSTNYGINPPDLLMAAKACESLLMEKENNPDLWLNNDPASPANSAAKPSLPEGRKLQTVCCPHTNLSSFLYNMVCCMPAPGIGNPIPNTPLIKFCLRLVRWLSRHRYLLSLMTCNGSLGPEWWKERINSRFSSDLH